MCSVLFQWSIPLVIDLARADSGTNRVLTDFHIGEEPIGGSGDNLTVTLDLRMGDHLCQMHCIDCTVIPVHAKLAFWRSNGDE